MQETKEKMSHSEQQAAAQLSSIIEMVRGLERETAVEDYVSGLNLEQCTKLLNEAEIDTKELSGDLSEDAQLERAREMVLESMEGRFPSIEPDDFEFDEDEARQRIQEDPLSVEVRKDWYTPGDEPEKPSEFCILLCTGGPAVRLLGDLNEHGSGQLLKRSDRPSREPCTPEGLPFLRPPSSTPISMLPSYEPLSTQPGTAKANQ